MALEPGPSPVLSVTQEGNRVPGRTSRHRLGMCIPGGGWKAKSSFQAHGSLPCGESVPLVYLLCVHEEVGHIACSVNMRDLHQKDFQEGVWQSMLTPLSPVIMSVIGVCSAALSAYGHKVCPRRMSCQLLRIALEKKKSIYSQNRECKKT